MSFDLGETSKTNDEMFYERKSHVVAERTAVDDAFQNNMVVHKDLFETISEAHYLPDLSGPHDEDLLESLVEKGCEDNQILGQALDKLAHLVHGSGDYAEEEDDMLLGGAPVTDIIDRLEQSLESPERSSITAAQGLLHLHHIGDHLPPMEHQQNVEQTYLTDEVFTSENPSECTLVTLTSVSETQAANLMKHIEYESNPEKILDSNIESANVIYTDPVPDTRETCENKAVQEQSHSAHDQSEIPSETTNSAVINEQITNTCSNGDATICDINDQNAAETKIDSIDFAKELAQSSNSEELLPTDLSIKHIEHSIIPHVVTSIAEMTNSMEDSMSEKSDEQPKDLSVHRRLPTPHASPRRLEMVRAPSRESDAMQSPQPSGIPAIPSSPEIFSMPSTTKSKQALFLETLLSSPSPKMYTSEVTITKQQCEPLNLGKHRKSASPTVSSCSDEIRKLNKDFGEPQEKRIKRESVEDLAKISKVFNKSCELESKSNKSEKSAHKSSDETSPLKQLQVLKTSPDFNIPDPLLVPKDKLNHILAAPGREIPALLIQRPELRLPEAFAFPAILQDPDILVISLSQLESILENDAKKLLAHKPTESKPIIKSSSNTEKNSTPQPDQSSQPKPIPSMDALAGDIDAATSATLNQMLWLPYLSQLEAMAACSQNMDFIKALSSTGYTGQSYPDVSQMFNPSSRFVGPSGFPMMPPMDYDSRLQFAMWQEAMNQANASAAQRSKPNAATEVQTKESASKSSDVQNPYVHSTKNHQSKPHSSARTSPIAHNYNNNQRTMNHNHFLQSMYPGMNPNIRHNLPLPGLQIPYFNPNLMGNQRSPRTGQQKSPTSPYFPNNNYLHSVKHSEGNQRSSSTGSQESPRPRISVRSLHNMMEPNSSAGSSVGSSSRRSSNTPVSSTARRREEPEVGSTTPLGELPPVQHLPPHLPPHPHDPSSFHLWHPLFGNQKGYNSPWSWTTVTATGD